MKAATAIAFTLTTAAFAQSGPERPQFEAATAKFPPGTSGRHRQLMEQNLLADRFDLQIHRETKEMRVYALVPAKRGVKLTPDPPDAEPGFMGFKGAGRSGLTFYFYCGANVGLEVGAAKGTNRNHSDRSCRKKSH